MFRIRRIYDDILPVNQTAIGEVQKIFAEQFPRASQVEMQELGRKLQNPFKQGFRPVLYVAERKGHVSGFALVLHEPELKFCFLDFIAAGKQVIGRGVGAALYEHVRDEALTSARKGCFSSACPTTAARVPTTRPAKKMRRGCGSMKAMERGQSSARSTNCQCRAAASNCCRIWCTTTSMANNT